MIVCIICSPLGHYGYGEGAVASFGEAAISVPDSQAPRVRNRIPGHRGVGNQGG